MAREVHAAGLRERRANRSNPSGKWDVGYFNDSGDWVHVARYSDEAAAVESARGLRDPSENQRRLLGVTGSEEIEVMQVP